MHRQSTCLIVSAPEKNPLLNVILPNYAYDLKIYLSVANYSTFLSLSSSSRLNFTTDPEEIQDVIRSLTNDTEYIQLASDSVDDCINDMPEDLNEYQQPLYIFRCMEERIRLACKLQLALKRVKREAEAALPL